MTTLLTVPGTVAIARDWHGQLPWVPDPATRKYLFRVEKPLAKLDMLLPFVDGNRERGDRLTASPLDPVTGLRPIVSTSRSCPRATLDLV